MCKCIGAGEMATETGPVDAGATMGAGAGAAGAVGDAGASVECL